MNPTLDGNGIAPAEIRPCGTEEIGVVAQIINDAAQAYLGVIPADCWKDPYMSMTELTAEISAGVDFWGYELRGVLVGVMGRQNKGEVALIRHAYVRRACRGHGIGGRLLQQLEALTRQPILVGTWAAASWAIRFYEKNRYRQVSSEEKDRLLDRYWRIPKRQVQTSVVLANSRWFSG